MATIDSLRDVVVGSRTYIPLLMIDADGRRAELKIPDPTNLPSRTRVVKPFICSDCAAVTLDPRQHNETHDGRCCDVFGRCDETFTGGVTWVDDYLCSACADPDTGGA